MNEMLFLVAALIALDRRDRMAEHVLITALALVMTFVICALVPTQTAPTAYGRPDLIIDQSVVDQVAALLSNATIIIDNVRGDVSFPSLHAAEAFLVVYLLRGIAWLFWPMLVFNALMLAATPFVGGHFFVDVLAGAAVFWVAAAICKRVNGWTPAMIGKEEIERWIAANPE